MRSNKIRNFNSQTKTKIVLDVLQEDATMVQLLSKYGVTSKMSQTIKFILGIYFCVIVLIASQCDSIHKTNLPSIPNEEDLKKNSNQDISISSTGVYAVVCIGSNNTIYIGSTDQKLHGNQGINPLNNSRQNNQNSIIPKSGSITITSTSAEGTVLIGSNNTVYRSIDMRKQEQTKSSHNSSSKENDKEKVEKAAVVEPAASRASNKQEDKQQKQQQGQEQGGSAAGSAAEQDQDQQQNQPDQDQQQNQQQAGSATSKKPSSRTSSKQDQKNKNH